MKWRRILWPFSLLYGSITGLRNLAFDHQLIKSEQFDIPVIAIGNLNTGGTGKTPMVEFILRNLPSINWGVVSRGHGRTTKGLIIPNQDHTADEMGDEPRQILSNFPTIKMALSEKRAPAIEALAHQCDAVLLDDAFQHRFVKADSYILLTTYGEPYFRDMMLPAGNLREPALGRKRASVIVVTKCPPDLKAGSCHEFRKKLKVYDHQKVFFATQIYQPARNHNNELLPAGDEVVLISGIANASHFVKEAEEHFKVQQHFRYKDHHRFTKAQIKKFSIQLKAGKKILTTQKDYVRLQEKINPSLLSNLFVLPIEAEMLFNENELFLRLIRENLSNTAR